MRLLTLMFMVTAGTTFVIAQKGECPAIELIGPASVTQPGETMTFTATLSSTPENIKYIWTVSRGVIEKGQGTQSIVVRTSLDDERQNFVAKLTVHGLPPVCNANASEIGPVAELPIGEPIDQFGVLPRNDIRGRVDNFFMELSNNPSNRGYVVIELGPMDKPNASNPRYRLILQHAVFRSFDFSRIDVAFERGDETGTTLWRVPPGARLPKCNCIPLKK